MATKQHKGGKKNRKHGNKKRKPCQIRYVAENRVAKNKARNIAKEKARQAR